MTIWELTAGGTNDYSVLAPSNRQEAYAGIFETDGRPKHWAMRPRVEPFFNKRLKKQKPVADVSYLIVGVLMLNKKAYLALSAFLRKFGEFLEVECNGETWYFYNVTHLIDCIDVANSVMSGTTIKKEAFNEAAIPSGPQIFKDHRLAMVHIYATQSAREIIEKLVTDAKLTGVRFIEAGQGLI